MVLELQRILQWHWSINLSEVGHTVWAGLPIR